MPWNKAQGQIDRMRVALRAWKDAFETYQAELKANRLVNTDGLSILQLTHERYADQGRVNVVALLDRQKAGEA